MNRQELIEWLADNARRLEKGSDDEKRVALILYTTAGTLELDTLPHLVDVVSNVSQGELGRITN